MCARVLRQLFRADDQKTYVGPRARDPCGAVEEQIETAFGEIAGRNETDERGSRLDAERAARAAAQLGCMLERVARSGVARIQNG